MSLVISPKIRSKLAAKSPPVTEEEILQCFANRSGQYLIDHREKNLTNPATRWFIAETDYGKKLKICFIPERNNIYIRTAYVPSVKEIKIYKKGTAPVRAVK